MKTPEKVRYQIGDKIRRLRQLRGLSQKEFAAKLDITQQAVSKIEQSDTVNEDTLMKVSEVLKLSTDAIVNFDEEAAFNNFIENNEVINQRCDITNNFQEIEKVTELYERLLKSEVEKNSILKELLELKSK